ncbi:ABC transporter permease [Aggregatilinea lenta]|uniref:ABC transporter permease n=1 Tax=Aggregatilinea lenta TaxID=913108 RepID=UPI000E5C4D80|nr:ABC transporter permease [Aggregatilinea lenta]
MSPHKVRLLWLIASGVVVLTIIILALLAPVLAPHDPLEINYQEVLKPSSSHYLLGTDEFGRDIFSRLLYGARPSLEVAGVATVVALVFGSITGVTAGYFGGWVEQVLMRLVDTLLCFPPILLAMVIVGFMGGGVTNLIVVIGILYSTSFARLAYSATLQVKEMEYMTAARAIGASSVRIIGQYVFPNILTVLIVQASLTVAASILLESGLSFLGLGVVPPTASWGLMIGAARGYMYQAPTYVLWPSLVIAVTVLAVNTFGDALRDVLDPRLKQ